MFTLTITKRHVGQGGDVELVKVVECQSIAENIDILSVIAAFNKPARKPRSDKGKTRQPELIQ